ncbi:MAG: glycosyltransferase [Natronospirillum sp.]
MRSLLIGKTWPEPASTAAGRRTHDILQVLAMLGDVHVASPAQRTVFSMDLTAAGFQEHDIAVNDDAFDGWLSELAPDFVVFDRYVMEEQFGWRVSTVCPDAVRVLDTSDLHCLREARAAQVKQGGTLSLFNETALREIASIARCDLTLMISPVELELLVERFQVPEFLLHHTPFMLTPLPDETTLVPYSARQHVVMIGNFLHAPNWDATLWLRDQWPQWRQVFPADTEVHVYGGYASDKVLQLHSPAQGFHIKGRADDAIATLALYRVNLAYLRYGAGIKGKVADAWLAGTPTVASPIAAEGMHGDLPWGSPITADAEAFFQAAADLYQKPEAWQQAVIQGRAIASQCHDTLLETVALSGRLMELQQDLAAHREHNLWGRILQQQQYRATEYMSRWITEKNRTR